MQARPIKKHQILTEVKITTEVKSDKNTFVKSKKNLIVVETKCLHALHQERKATQKYR